MWAALPGMTEELVAEITAYRAEKNFNSVMDVQSIVGPDVFRGIAQYITTGTTPYYRISSTGRITGSRISDGVTVMIRFDNQIDGKYEIIEWVDEPDLQNHRKRTPVS